MILLILSPISLSPLSFTMSAKLPPFGHLDQRVGLAGVLVRHVLHEQQRQDVVLVLRGVHAAAQLVAALPEGAVELGFLQRHGSVPARARWSFSCFCMMTVPSHPAATQAALRHTQGGPSLELADCNRWTRPRRMWVHVARPPRRCALTGHLGDQRLLRTFLASYRSASTTSQQPAHLAHCHEGILAHPGLPVGVTLAQKPRGPGRALGVERPEPLGDGLEAPPHGRLLKAGWRAAATALGPPR